MNPLSHIKKNIILASKSPRRQHLLKDLGVDFEIRTKEVEEIYPPELKREQVALFLSELKATAFAGELTDNDILITSDTIVCLGDRIIGKPKDRDDAFNMLSDLSGNKHEVITAVTFTSANKQHSFFVETEVYFKTLSNFEIDYYINKYQPFDKAGSYGIQEWIGYIGIEKIVGFRFPGELMGEDALFLERYNYSAVALGDNSVCEVFVEPLSACSQLAPELQQNLIQLLTKQSYEQQRNAHAITGKKSADCLLAAFLLNICQRNAKHSGSESVFELTISRQDIACFLGIRRETLSRLLSKFQHEQLINLNGKQLTLLSLNQLKKLANL